MQLFRTWALTLRWSIWCPSSQLKDDAYLMNDQQRWVSNIILDLNPFLIPPTLNF